MTTHLGRFSALALGATILSAGATAAIAPAHAADPYVAVSWSDWDAGTNVLLNARATADVNGDENTASTVCGQAINAAIAVGLPMSDEAREICEGAVLACVHDAVRVRGNALSGVRFYSGELAAYPAGGYRCLVR